LVISTSPAGNLARSLTADGMSPVSSSALRLLLERLADARDGRDLALAGEGHDRDARVTHGLGRRAVGDHAVRDGAVELVEVSQLVERGGDFGIGLGCMDLR
jgi:hypothetical protein